MEGDSVKRSAAPGGSPEKKRAKAAPLPLGVEKIQNQGEGNCLFLAVSQAIDNSGGGAHNHRSVRAAAVTHLRKHAAKYALSWDGLRPDGTKMDSIWWGRWGPELATWRLPPWPPLWIDQSLFCMSMGKFTNLMLKAVNRTCFCFIRLVAIMSVWKPSQRRPWPFGLKVCLEKLQVAGKTKGVERKLVLGPSLKPVKVRWGGTLVLPEATRLWGTQEIRRAISGRCYRPF